MSFNDSHERWAAGRCPCCGGTICPWEWQGVETLAASIAEGVTICGRCIANDHLDAPELVEAMLDDIANPGGDRVERLLAAVGVIVVRLP